MIGRITMYYFAILNTQNTFVELSEMHTQYNQGEDIHNILSQHLIECFALSKGFAFIKKHTINASKSAVQYIRCTINKIQNLNNTKEKTEGLKNNTNNTTNNTTEFDEFKSSKKSTKYCKDCNYCNDCKYGQDIKHIKKCKKCDFCQQCLDLNNLINSDSDTISTLESED
jgi:hypothetical protein